jgi:hypothetical protein
LIKSGNGFNLAERLPISVADSGVHRANPIVIMFRLPSW